MDVVFHVSSTDLGDWRHAIHNVRNLLNGGTVETDTVTPPTNGSAALLFPDGSPVRGRLGSLFEAGVRCCACRNPLDGRGFDTDRLADGVEVIPSGVDELVTRQAAGDAYLKVPQASARVTPNRRTPGAPSPRPFGVTRRPYSSSSRTR